MSVRRTIALAGTSLALASVPTAAALAAGSRSADGGQTAAAGTSVTVRVEGVSRVLLRPTAVTVPSRGPITKAHAPAGTCSASTAAGALDAATHHNWNGTYSSSNGLGIEVTSILGETDKYSPHGHYWGIYVGNAFASAGICGLKLHRGEQILFAAVPAQGTVYPLGLSGPSRVTAGKTFSVKVLAYDAKGVAKPVAGVRVSGASGVSNRHGLVSVIAPHTRKLTLTATGKGFIRSAPITVKVS